MLQKPLNVDVAKLRCMVTYSRSSCFFFLLQSFPSGPDSQNLFCLQIGYNSRYLIMQLHQRILICTVRWEKCKAIARNTYSKLQFRGTVIKTSSIKIHDIFHPLIKSRKKKFHSTYGNYVLSFYNNNSSYHFLKIYEKSLTKSPQTT